MTQHSKPRGRDQGLAGTSVGSLLPILVLAVALAYGCDAGTGQARPPNLIFILADDLGWTDTGAYGSQYYETPHIDALAQRGMTFTNAYAAAAICSPTRASILTGLHPARIGITTAAGHLEREVLEKSLRSRGPAIQPALIANSLTRLRLDYFTLAEALGAAGYRTAHFGKWHLGRGPFDPLNQGFEIDLPHTHGPGPSGGYLGPWNFWPGEGADGEHIEDRMATGAADFIRQNSERPFFLNYWCFSVHAPIQGKPDLVDKYRAKADPKMAQRNPIMGAMVESLDDAVGTLLSAVDEMGIADETIIVFFSDNGGMVHRLNAGVPVTSNEPLRSGKSSIYEGGVREPLIVAWPPLVTPGSRSDEIVQSIDFYPTLLELTGVPAREGQSFDVSVRAGREKSCLNRWTRTMFLWQPSGYAADSAAGSAKQERVGGRALRRLESRAGSSRGAGAGGGEASGALLAEPARPGETACGDLAGTLCGAGTGVGGCAAEDRAVTRAGPGVGAGEGGPAAA